jgi:hypothetical protein
MTRLLGDATINELEGALLGSLVRPGDGEYEVSSIEVRVASPHEIRDHQPYWSWC